MTTKTIVILLVVLVLGGIAYFITTRTKEVKTSLSQDLAFPVKLLPEDQLKGKYQVFDHTLSPIPEYQFQMAMPKDWKTVNVALAEQIKPGDTTFHQIGLFQKRDSQNNPVVEIEVSTANLDVSKPLVNLKDFIIQLYGSKLITMENHRQIGTTGQDALFTFKDENGQQKVGRTYMYRNAQGSVFMISGFASLGDYNSYADDFYSAMSTFEPYQK